MGRSHSPQSPVREKVPPEILANIVRAYRDNYTRVACVMIAFALIILACPIPAAALEFEDAHLPPGISEAHVHLIALAITFVIAFFTVVAFRWRRHD